MSWPLLQFVSGPDATATVRYDFNTQDATCRTYPLQNAGLDLGTPAFTGEPGAVGVDYGYRQQRFTQRISGTRAVALAKMSALAREILRVDNWLKFQWSPDLSPVYFRTYRGQPGELSLENAGHADVWDITVPIVAEGFAYGARVTALAGTTITPNSTATNPLRVALPAIKGDAPTGLRVTVKPSIVGTLVTLNTVWMVGCVAGDAALTDPVNEIGTADGFTAGTGTGAAVASAAYSGGSHRVVTIGAATPNLLDRLSGAHTGLVASRYKILLRVELDAPAGGKTFLFQYVQRTTGSFATSKPGKVVSYTVNPLVSDQAWVDLGDFTFPFGNNAPAGIAALTQPSFILRMGTVDGSTATARIDAFKFLPVAGPAVRSAKFLKASYPDTPLWSPVRGTFDADLETYWATDNAGSSFIDQMPALTGGFPVADPAAGANTLYLIPTSNGGASSVVGATNTISSVGAAADVDVTYNPRYLYVGDGT